MNWQWGIEGIVRSTLFNALTKAGMAAENLPAARSSCGSLTDQGVPRTRPKAATRPGQKTSCSVQNDKVSLWVTLLLLSGVHAPSLGHQKMEIRVFLSVAALAWALVGAVAQASDDLTTLNLRKADLESQLRALNERIAAVESASAASSVSNAPPKYFVKNFGIDSVNSAGGVGLISSSSIRIRPHPSSI